MKKIQVSTIQMQCNAEVVVLNSYTVAKAAQAAVGVKMFKDISEALGNPKFEEEFDSDGDPILHYTIHRDQLGLLVDFVFPFIEELDRAFKYPERSEHE